MVIFFFLILALFLILNSYVLFRIISVFSQAPFVKTTIIIIYIALVILFIFRMVYGDRHSFIISKAISVISFSWLILFIYAFMIILFIDIIRLSNSVFSFFNPAFIDGDIYSTRKTVFSASLALLITIYIIGTFNFYNLQVTRLSINLDRKLEAKVKVVFLSDLHLSSLIDHKYLEKIVNKINSENPDIVIFGGDIVDREIEPLLQYDAASILRRIKSKWGVYAVSGNHEFYGGDRDEILKYLSSSGIIFLKDSLVNINNIFYIAGREDKTNPRRESIEKIIGNRDLSLPLILVDHQPYNMDEALSNGVDLKLSGHTHNGQFWPGNLIVKLIFENPYGYLVKDQMHTYVSSGAGIWGPLFRLGSKSEIVSIDINI